MSTDIKHLYAQKEAYTFYIKKLAVLFEKMDRAYTRLAAEYAFDCRGCIDNCCKTHFYHHTFLEFIYLSRGLSTLDPEERKDIKRKAETVCKASTASHAADHSFVGLCPLNEQGLCRLYAYRPMICRLHGIPHKLKGPRGEVSGPGCDSFYRQCASTPNTPFDRTPFYTEMARLEQGLRGDAGLNQKIKMTVAQMIPMIVLSFEAGGSL